MAEFLLYSDGDNKALRDAIFKATPKAIEQTKTIASRFKGATDMDTCRNIWNFLKNEIKYVADGQHQKVKLPSALLREKVGDCKSYSLFAASILQNLGIPWHYVLTSYNNDPTPSHIYVVCDNGVIVDAVWTAFNQEKKPNYRYKHKINDMRISYIAGIPAKKTALRGCGGSCSCTPCRARYGTTPIRGTSVMMSGNNRMLGTDSKFMGIGRTGYDWLKAATGREATYGEIAEYGLKNVSLAPARFLLEKFIANNGGGIANFLYNAWLGSDEVLLPNGYKYNDEYNAELKAVKSRYFYLDKPAFAFTKEELSKMNSGFTPADTSSPLVFNPNQKATSVGMTIQQALTPARYQEYLKYNQKRDAEVKEFNKVMEDFRKELDKKYPPNTRSIKPATEKSKQKYRDIELMWFWKLGGSPDDLNNAVKEGNTKSPRGRDANYMLMKAADGKLSAKDLGLVIRAFFSAFGGDKFGLGDDGTYVVTIGGLRKKLGIGEPVTAAAAAAGAAAGTAGAATTSATITAYIVPITESIVGLVTLLASLGAFGSSDAESKNENIDPSLIPSVSQNYGKGGSDGGNEGGGDNTNMLLILGAVAVGGFLLLNK